MESIFPTKFYQLGWGVADNAPVCDKAIKQVAARIDPVGKTWIPKERRGRCMEHSVHCATRAFIETISPRPIHLVKRVLAAGQGRRRTTIEDVEDEGEPDDPDTAAMMAELATMDDDDVDTDFDPKDLLGKILAFVNQVRASPQARKYFRKLCVEENVKPLQLLKWVRTRWASLYDLIARLLEVQPVSLCSSNVSLSS